MTDFQTALLDKARRALDAAAVALDHDDVETATNRAYYACFYVAQAALDAHDERPKTHRGTHGRFRFHYVVSGQVAEDVARALPFAGKARERTDYDAFELTDVSAAADLVADAEQFVDVVGRVVRSQ